MAGNPDLRVRIVGTGDNPDATVAIVGDQVVDLTGAEDGDALVVQIQDSQTTIVPGEPQSSSGAQFLSGSGAPDSGDGDDGDFWLDVDTTTLWGPKVDGSWVGTDVSLIGPEGEPGPGQNFLEAVANAAALPAVGNTVNDFRVTEDDGHAHRWDGAAWIDVGQYRGTTGATGAQGDAGLGLPAGGTTGQVLRKATATDHDTEWTSAIEVDALAELAETPADGDMIPVLDVSDTSGGTLPNGTTKKVSKANLVAGSGAYAGGVILTDLAATRNTATAVGTTKTTYKTLTIPAARFVVGSLLRLRARVEVNATPGSLNVTPEIAFQGIALPGPALTWTNFASGSSVGFLDIHLVPASATDLGLFGALSQGSPAATRIQQLANGKSWTLSERLGAGDGFNPATDIAVAIKFTMDQASGAGYWIEVGEAVVEYVPAAA